MSDDRPRPPVAALRQCARCRLFFPAAVGTPAPPGPAPTAWTCAACTEPERATPAAPRPRSSP